MATWPAFARRVVALGLLLLIVGGLAAAAIVPLWRNHEAYDQRIGELRHQIDRFTLHASQRPALERQRAQMLALYGDGFYLSGQTEALAAAELQRTVRQAVTQAGGELRSTQVMTAEEEEGFQRIAIRVQLRGGINTLRDALYALETGKPYLFVNDLRIRALNAVRGRHPGSVVDLLDVSFELYGYRAKRDVAGGKGNV